MRQVDAVAAARLILSGVAGLVPSSAFPWHRHTAEKLALAVAVAADTDLHDDELDVVVLGSVARAVQWNDAVTPD